MGYVVQSFTLSTKGGSINQYSTLGRLDRKLKTDTMDRGSTYRNLALGGWFNKLKVETMSGGGQQIKSWHYGWVV